MLGGIALDGQGNIYVSGSYSESATFGTTKLSTTCQMCTEIFVYQILSSGSPGWAVSSTSAVDHWGYPLGIATDQNGVAITGYFSSSIAFGAKVLSTSSPPGQPDNDGFLARVSYGGAFVSAVSFGGPAGDDEGDAIELDGAGNAFIAGYFYSSLNAGSTILKSYGGEDAFVIKIDASGTATWGASGGAISTTRRTRSLSTAVLTSSLEVPATGERSVPSRPTELETGMA